MLFVLVDKLLSSAPVPNAVFDVSGDPPEPKPCPISSEPNVVEAVPHSSVEPDDGYFKTCPELPPVAGIVKAPTVTVLTVVTAPVDVIVIAVSSVSSFCDTINRKLVSELASVACALIASIDAPTLFVSAAGTLNNKRVPSPTAISVPTGRSSVPSVKTVFAPVLPPSVFLFIVTTPVLPIDILGKSSVFVPVLFCVKKSIRVD